MSTRTINDEQALDALRREYPGHNIWRARRRDGLAGDWCATLLNPNEGIDPTVIRSAADDLWDELAQERRRARNRGSL
ncbi:hypothetical protein [Actinomadura rupiterrae]|uniref:hypothetical protein n=1 Tax=Actinomadura rupiterrae TaxID=559627 RepID=UPI0020A433CC|nr:hypothetical protein [Actinomadura rupiterrae]MCP2336814.1 hypothetical protein [Actinomadura rupiterrae]